MRGGTAEGGKVVCVFNILMWEQQIPEEIMPVPGLSFWFLSFCESKLFLSLRLKALVFIFIFPMSSRTFCFYCLLFWALLYSTLPFLALLFHPGSAHSLLVGLFLSSPGWPSQLQSSSPSVSQQGTWYYGWDGSSFSRTLAHCRVSASLTSTVQFQ